MFSLAIGGIMPIILRILKNRANDSAVFMMIKCAHKDKVKGALVEIEFLNSDSVEFDDTFKYESLFHFYKIVLI